MEIVGIFRLLIFLLRFLFSEGTRTVFAALPVCSIADGWERISILTSDRNIKFQHVDDNFKQLEPVHLRHVDVCKQAATQPERRLLSVW